jgi:hypothetical protein
MKRHWGQRFISGFAIHEEHGACLELEWFLQDFAGLLEN